MGKSLIFVYMGAAQIKQKKNHRMSILCKIELTKKFFSDLYIRVYNCFATNNFSFKYFDKRRLNDVFVEILQSLRTKLFFCQKGNTRSDQDFYQNLEFKANQIINSGHTDILCDFQWINILSGTNNSFLKIFASIFSQISPNF